MFLWVALGRFNSGLDGTGIQVKKRMERKGETWVWAFSTTHSRTYRKKGCRLPYPMPPYNQKITRSEKMDVLRRSRQTNLEFSIRKEQWDQDKRIVQCLIVSTDNSGRKVIYWGSGNKDVR
ncbi:hypothetical protein NPIL_36441 [Nephila pilipes]|uniref:Uncharacterized protein n=1 Tax=Nephila pilipes TaxID=299642 RepID=A0A8X6NVL7_NEPPI|nr:hypothetical protein NPIL_36441 [Nephila pilipes]